MEIEDSQTVLFFLIHESGMTEGLNTYIKAIQAGDQRNTARAWLALSETEQTTVLNAHDQLRSAA